MILKKVLLTLALSFAVISFGGVTLSSRTFALATPLPVVQFAACDPGSFFGFPSWFACLPKDSDGNIQITSINDLWLIVFPLLETAVKIGGYVAFGYIIWGSIKYIKSQGNGSETANARDIIRDAIIGLTICLLAVGIVQFFASRV